MIRSARLVAGLCGVLLLPACGGSASDSAPTRTGTPSPSASAAPVTPAKAKLIAAAGVLAAADLPGYTTAPQERDPQEQAEEAKIATCVGTPVPTYLASDPGRTFSKADVEIASSSDVASSIPAARAYVEALASTKTPECVKASLAEPGLTVTSFSLKPVPLTVPGADRALAYDYAVAASTPEGNIDIRGYEAVALVGPAVLEISVYGGSQKTFSTAQLGELVTKVVARARAAS